ncbi:MAG TPA: zf-HC2 domain-containing protein [Thermoanaerobaculia bacterium]|nr:zf-HC2 domain-containing protein [Thermoanaerobaculia bacterium]
MPEPAHPAAAGVPRSEAPRPDAPCGRRFPEELLSGFLDGVLTQSDQQRVRLHLEDCPSCRAQVAELAGLREAALTTRFVLPADDQWDERPRTGWSRLARRTGFTLLVLWFLAVAAAGLWGLATGPASVLEKVMVLGGLAAAALLFASVLADRLRTLPGDRYRGVQK